MKHHRSLFEILRAIIHSNDSDGTKRSKSKERKKRFTFFSDLIEFLRKRANVRKYPNNKNTAEESTSNRQAKLSKKEKKKLNKKASSVFKPMDIRTSHRMYESIRRRTLILDVLKI